MEEPLPERRSRARSVVEVLVRVQYTGQEFSAPALNLSAGGVFLETRLRLPVGTRISLRFSLPLIAKYPIRAEGEVVWLSAASTTGFAVRFVGISDEDRDLLGELSDEFDKLLDEA